MAAKKKSPKKLDKNQLFVVQTVSRQFIADALNNALEDEDGVDEVDHFSPDDPRLTDKICQEFADTLYEEASDNLLEEQEHVERDVARTFVHKFA